MNTPLCTACPISSRCALRAARAPERAHVPEPELRMLELRKRDESSLTDVVRERVVIVRQGAFKVLTGGRDILQIVSAGELFGPDLHFMERPPEISAKSLMPDITLCTTGFGTFEKWMNERRSLERQVVQTLAERSMHARLAFHWTKKSLRERAILTLHHLRERFGVPYGQFRMIDVPLTKIDIASLMSTVQESAVRALSEFREDGLISANGKRIVILDNGRLDRLREEILIKDRETAESSDDSPTDPDRSIKNN